MARESVFRFKQFSVLNHKTAMKVGTDGILLGAWCEVSEAKCVLDVGTGCGLIALMVAQRNNHCNIDGIDIDEDAIEEARFNFSQSPWSDRLKAFMDDFNHHIFENKYDLIVSNPPFFTDGIVSPHEKRRKARHMTELSIEQLIVKSVSLLSDSGRLCFITPANIEDYVMKCCSSISVFISKKVAVSTKIDAIPKRYLWEISKKSTVAISSNISIYNEDNNYTDQFTNLCKDFYLKI